LEGHSDSINAVTITPDGKLAVSASKDETLKVWDLQTGECRRTLRGHRDRVTSLAVTTDGKLAVSASIDKTIKVWNLVSGEEITSFIGESEMTSCVVSLDGRTIVAGERSGRVHFLSLEGAEA
jgi:WD40 repeat protein